MNSVIIVGGGKGSRIGRKINKQFIKLREKPIIAYTIEKFEKMDLIDEIILVVGKNEVDYALENIVNKYGYKKVKKVIEGGSERPYSVLNGLNEVNESNNTVIIHDGVRPFITEELIEKCIDQIRKYNGVVLGVKVKDTIKTVKEGSFIEKTLKRSSLYQIQTPQVFKKDVLLRAYKEKKEYLDSVTDDSSLVELLGEKIKLIEGSYDNIKITTVEDLDIAEKILDKE